MSILKKFHKIINNGIIFLVMVPLLILVFVFKSPLAKKNIKRKKLKNNMDIVKVIQETILFFLISLSLYVYLRKLAFFRDDDLLKTLAFHMMLLTMFMKSMKLSEIILVTYVKFIPTHFMLIMLNIVSFITLLSFLFNVERKIDSALIYLFIVYTLLIYLIVLTANILTALFIFSNKNKNIISGEKYGDKKLATYKIGLKEVTYENKRKRHLTADTLTLTTINILYFSFIFMIKFTGLSTILANKFR
jgi:hypothetical protein